MTNGKSIIDERETARRLSLVVPPPVRRWLPAKKPLEWAVGIVAAPRAQGKVSYLKQTIASCAHAGFPRPWIFAEPGCPGLYVDGTGRVRLRGYDGPVTLNGERCGVYPNHYLAAVALRHSQATANANAYMILEDDVLIAKGTREYLERYALWPCTEQELGALCLFTHQFFADMGPGWHRYTHDVWYSLWGAQSLVFSRFSMDEWLASPIHRLHQEKQNPAANRFADAELTRWADAMGKQIWFPVGRYGESLVSHRGGASSVFGDGMGPISRRSEAMFADQTVLAEHWRDPPRGRESVVVSTEPLRNGPQMESKRREHRLPICENCPSWVAPDEIEQRRLPQGCDQCATPGKKPTLETIGSIQAICKRGLW